MSNLSEHLVDIFIIALAIAGILLGLCGCRSQSAFSYYESGQIASAMYSDGMIEWSDGAGKIMPFGSINVNGVGIK